MCTIALLPGPPGHLLLLGNRDEMRQRARATPPQRVTPTSGRAYMHPVDAQAGGTWIGVNSAGIAMTLLNNYQAGAIFDTEGVPLSRGLISPQLLSLDTLQDMETAFRATWEERAARTFPFVLIAAGAQSPGEALQIAWDGVRLEIDYLSTPLISISSGFDLEGVTVSRQRTLSPLLDESFDWMSHDLDELSATFFAQGAPDQDAYSVAMSREDAHTVSHTRILVTPTHTRADYFEGPPTLDNSPTSLSLTQI